MFSIYDILILRETWLLSDIGDIELGLISFQIFGLERNPDNNSSSFGGGGLITIKCSLKFHSIPLIISKVDQVFALLCLNTNYLLVGGVYLPLHLRLIVVESHISSVEYIL